MYVFGSGRGCWRRVGERIWFGLYQSWRNRGKVGYVSVFWLRWCGGSGWAACPKNGKGRHNLHMVCHTTVTATPRVGCVFWSHRYSSTIT